MTLPAIKYPDPSAQIAPYVEVLGPQLAIRFLLKFGGAQLYLTQNPKGRSEAEHLIGADRLRLLAQRADSLSRRVPLGNLWLAAALSAEGQSVAEIARQLHASASPCGRGSSDLRRGLQKGSGYDRTS